MTLQTFVTNITDNDEVAAEPANGAYVYGFYLEGAGWELGRA
jgi:hypothetical protein